MKGTQLSDYDYNLPTELIASYPAYRRDQSKLLKVSRSGDEFKHLLFGDLDPTKLESTIFESYMTSIKKDDIENKFSALGKEWTKNKKKSEETVNEFNPEVFSNFNLSSLEDS